MVVVQISKLDEVDQHFEVPIQDDLLQLSDMRNH